MADGHEAGLADCTNRLLRRFLVLVAMTCRANCFDVRWIVVQGIAIPVVRFHWRRSTSLAGFPLNHALGLLVTGVRVVWW
jgi:hypothetical protein